VLVLLSALLLVATACGGSDDDDGAAASGSGTKITIENLEFAPETLSVKVGDTITVDNKDEAEHSVTAVDKSFDTGTFGAGTKTFTITRAGRFEYMCVVHPFMAHRFIQVA
jgi:plastocyanin